MRINQRSQVAAALWFAQLCVGIGPALSQGPPEHQVQQRPEDSDEPGKRGRKRAESSALRFTADGQHVLVPRTDSLDTIEGDLTVEAWVRPEMGILARGYSSIVSKQMSGTGYMLATNNRANTPVPGHAFKAEVAGLQVTSDSQPAINGWQHVAAVWNDGRLRIYVNGQLSGTLETGPPISNYVPLWIGSSPFGTDTNWRGSVDEVRIWAIARTQKQLQSTMNRYLCGHERGLRAYWSFDEGQGNEIRDTTGDSGGFVSGPEWVAGVALATNPRCGQASKGDPFERGPTANAEDR